MKNTANVLITCTPEFKKKLKIEAAKKDKNLSEYIREAINEKMGRK